MVWNDPQLLLFCFRNFQGSATHGRSLASPTQQNTTTTTDDNESFNIQQARPYQVEILEQATEENTIVCLGTGTGKTFISVMLIREKQGQIGGNLADGGKRTFFLVNTGTYHYSLAITIYNNNYFLGVKIRTINKLQYHPTQKPLDL